MMYKNIIAKMYVFLFVLTNIVFSVFGKTKKTTEIPKKKEINMDRFPGDDEEKADWFNDPWQIGMCVWNDDEAEHEANECGHKVTFQGSRMN